MDASAISARPAQLHEGARLTELARRAKSHWGYSEEFHEAARADLTIDSDTIRSASIYVVERQRATIGFYGLLGNPPRGRLEWMFVEPEALGSGYGRWMWNDAMQRAKAAGFVELRIESDRFAEPFYEAMGAIRIGVAASPVDGAPLPVFKVDSRAEAAQYRRRAILTSVVVRRRGDSAHAASGHPSPSRLDS